MRQVLSRFWRRSTAGRSPPSAGGVFRLRRPHVRHYSRGRHRHRQQRVAFSGCSGLANMAIPASVTEISLSRFRAGREAFTGCSGLTSIEVNPGNAVYASDEGVLLNAARTEVLYSPKGKQGAYTIPESITSTGFTSPAWNGCPAVRIDERACPAAPWLVSHGLPLRHRP